MEHHYTDGTEPTILPHMTCSGPCRQGRLPCPTPDACQRSEEGDAEILAAVLLAILCVAVIGALAIIIIGAYA